VPLISPMAQRRDASVMALAYLIAVVRAIMESASAHLEFPLRPQNVRSVAASPQYPAYHSTFFSQDRK
jgi:hypothetical protein